MQENDHNANELQKRVHASEERLRLVEAASGIATFDLELTSGIWKWSPQATSLFGLDAASLQDWQQTVFVDDLPKVRAAVKNAAQTGSFYTEFRIRHADRSLHWIAGRGQATSSDTLLNSLLSGALYEITDRKALEARLLAVNEPSKQG